MLKFTKDIFSNVRSIVIEILALASVVLLTYTKKNTYIYTVGTESIQTPLNFSLFVILQPFAKII